MSEYKVTDEAATQLVLSPVKEAETPDSNSILQSNVQGSPSVSEGL